MGYFILALAMALLLPLLLPLQKGLQFFATAKPEQFLSWDWSPQIGHYGFGLPLVGSIYLIALSFPCIMGLGWVMCYQVARLPEGRLKDLVNSLLQTWNSLPSVVIGLWGINQVVPLVRSLSGFGYSLLATVIGLVAMATPTTVILLSQALKEHTGKFGPLETSFRFDFWDTTKYFLLANRSALRHVSVYTFCRLFGETLVVLMLSGNATRLPTTPFQSFRTLTSTIALEMSYASGTHELALYGAAAVAIIALVLCLSVGRVAHE